jgi:hypothetical protein
MAYDGFKKMLPERGAVQEIIKINDGLFDIKILLENPTRQEILSLEKKFNLSKNTLSLFDDGIAIRNHERLFFRSLNVSGRDEMRLDFNIQTESYFEFKGEIHADVLDKAMLLKVECKLNRKSDLSLNFEYNGYLIVLNSDSLIIEIVELRKVREIRELCLDVIEFLRLITMEKISPMKIVYTLQNNCQLQEVFASEELGSFRSLFKEKASHQKKFSDFMRVGNKNYFKEINEICLDFKYHPRMKKYHIKNLFRAVDLIYGDGGIEGVKSKYLTNYGKILHLVDQNISQDVISRSNVSELEIKTITAYSSEIRNKITHTKKKDLKLMNVIEPHLSDILIFLDKILQYTLLKKIGYSEDEFVYDYFDMLNEVLRQFGFKERDDKPDFFLKSNLENAKVYEGFVKRRLVNSHVFTSIATNTGDYKKIEWRNFK